MRFGSGIVIAKNLDRVCSWGEGSGVFMDFFSGGTGRSPGNTKKIVSGYVFCKNSPLQEHREAPFVPPIGPSDLAQERTRELKNLSTVRAAGCWTSPGQWGSELSNWGCW